MIVYLGDDEWAILDANGYGVGVVTFDPTTGEYTANADATDQDVDGFETLEEAADDILAVS